MSPVNFENGKGYFISQGYFLPPLIFTIEESNALILLNTLAGTFTDNSIVKHSRNALDKIKDVLRDSDMTKAEDLASLINFFLLTLEKKMNQALYVIQSGFTEKTFIRF